MKKRNLLVKSLIAMSILMVSCNDDDNKYQCPDDITGELSTTETNFSGIWTLQSIVTEDEIDLTDDNVDNPSTDIFSQYSECEQDITYNFASDRSYTFLLGTTASNCNNKQTISGTWSLNESDYLTLIANCSRQQTLIEVNDTNNEFSIKKTYKFTDVNSNTITTATTSTYKKTVEP